MLARELPPAARHEDEDQQSFHGAVDRYHPGLVGREADKGHLRDL